MAKLFIVLQIDDVDPKVVDPIDLAGDLLDITDDPDQNHPVAAGLIAAEWE